jgi:hypothetical protein
MNGNKSATGQILAKPVEIVEGAEFELVELKSPPLEPVIGEIFGHNRWRS